MLQSDWTRTKRRFLRLLCFAALLLLLLLLSSHKQNVSCCMPKSSQEVIGPWSRKFAKVLEPSIDEESTHITYVRKKIEGAQDKRGKPEIPSAPCSKTELHARPSYRSTTAASPSPCPTLCQDGCRLQRSVVWRAVCTKYPR